MFSVTEITRHGVKYLQAAYRTARVCGYKVCVFACICVRALYNSQCLPVTRSSSVVPLSC